MQFNGDTAALALIVGDLGLVVWAAPTATAALAIICGGSFLLGVLACNAGAFVGNLLSSERRPRREMSFTASAVLLTLCTMSSLATGIPGTMAVIRNYPNNTAALWEILYGVTPIYAVGSAAIFVVLGCL
jgi:hypothetical protein